MARRKSYPQVIADGIYLDSLCATRDQIAEDLDSCDSKRDKAALYNRLLDVLARIDELTPKEKVGDPVDEIAKRRAVRRSGTA